MRLKSILPVFLIVFILLFSVSAGASHGSAKRVVAHTDVEAQDAISDGCKLVRKTRGVTAFVCPEGSVSAGRLMEDVRVYAVDSAANRQIGANLVHVNNTGAGVRIVVLDTGYNYNHTELSSSYLGGYDFVNDDTDPVDDNGHGTHVSGIITADGIVARAKGVAPSAGIIAGKVLGSSGSGYFSDVVAAIYWAVDGPDGILGTGDDFNASAISMSIGTGAPYVYKGFCDSVLPDVTKAIKYAVGKGVIVVVAAGNSGNAGVSIPGCINQSTTVGAVDAYDKIASFSGRGAAVDITAPGVSLYSTWLGTGYYIASGTSMATPVVSGTVALIKAAHPDYNVAQLQAALFKTARDLGTTGWDKAYGWGRVNASAAVK